MSHKTLKARTKATIPSTVTTTTRLPVQREFTVPYSQLFLSGDNVRKTPPSTEGVKRLAALIATQGLQNPLQVSAEMKDGKPTGRYGVEAGGRRWRALGLLVATGRMPGSEPVPCKEVTRDASTEASLAENIAQEAMHPADEFAAFARLVGEARSVETIAARFGVPTLHVQRRLKLAAVAPSLMKLYREDKATLDQMMALASVDDQKRQVAVWNALPSYSRDAHQIRRKLTEEEVSQTDDRVKLITVERYLASGGAMRTDLFSNDGYLVDPGLVDLLVAEVIEECAAAVRQEGWSWVETMPAFGHAERQAFPAAPVAYRAETETEAEAQAREALEAASTSASEALESLYDGDDESEETAARIETLEAELSAIGRRLAALSEALIDAAGFDKSALGAVVTADCGELKVLRGLMTAEAARKALAACGAGPTDAASLTGKNKGKPEVPESLMVNLTSHRTAAMQAALLDNHSVALAALADGLAQSFFAGRTESPVKVRLTECRAGLERNATAFDRSPARARLDAEAARWTQALPQDRDEWFAWLCGQSAETVLDLIVFCTSQSIDTVQRRGEAQAATTRLSTALQLDMKDWWEASPATYLSLVPKAKLIEAVTEAVGADAAKDLCKLKKDEAVAHAAAKLAGTHWLPAPLRAA